MNQPFTVQLRQSPPTRSDFYRSNDFRIERLSLTVIGLSDHERSLAPSTITTVLFAEGQKVYESFRPTTYHHGELNVHLERFEPSKAFRLSIRVLCRRRDVAYPVGLNTREPVHLTTSLAITDRSSEHRHSILLSLPSEG